MKIRNKLILILTLLSIVPVLTLGFIGIYEQKALEKQIGDSSLELARVSMRRITEYLYEKLNDSQSWTYNVSTEDIMSNDSNNNVSRYFTRLTEDYDDYYYINCLNNKGKVIASSNTDLIESDLSANAGFRDALNGNPSIQDVSFDEVAGDYSVVMFIPVTDRTEQTDIIGVFKVALIWSKVIDMITNIKIGDKEQTEANHIMLTNEDGMVIFCIDPNEMFTTNLIDIGMKAAKYAQKHKEGYLIETTEHGLKTFATYTYSREYKDLPHLHWILVLEQDPKTAFATIGSLKKTMIFTLSGTVTFLIIFSFLFANRISKPILEVVSAAKAIGKGDMNTKVSVKSKDEIGQLADSFRTMIINLRESRDNLEQSEERYRDLIENSSELIYQTDEEGFFVEVNRTMLKKLGFRPEEIKAMRAEDIVPTNKREAMVKHVQKTIETGNDSIETIFLTKNREELYVEINAASTYDSNNNITEIKAFAHDISEKKTSEIKEKHERDLQLLSSQIVLVQEEEKRRLSRELHDITGQALTAVKFNIEMMEKEIFSSLSPKNKQRFVETKQLLTQALNEICSLSFGLRPPLLDYYGILIAIKGYSRTFSERTNLGIKVHSKNIKDERFSTEIEILLYRCAQEALNNVAKHSEAKNVSLYLAKNDYELLMKIKDDGKGFDAKKHFEKDMDSSSMGLFSMSEKIAHVGGKLRVSSEKNVGTVLGISVPLELNIRESRNIL